MKLRIFWLITLCFFLSGCAGYRQARLPQNIPPSGIDKDPNLEIVKPGDEVRLELVGGWAVEGKVVALDDERLVIEEELAVYEDVYVKENVVTHEIPVADVVFVARYHRRTVSMAVIGVGAAVLLLVSIVAIGKDIDREMKESW